MKFLKFYIDADFVDKHKIKITCIVESDDKIGCKDTKDCNKVKLGKGKVVDLGEGRTVNWL